MQKQSLTVKSPKHRRSIVHSPKTPVPSTTSIKKKPKHLSENIVMRNNLSYYDFNEIKWAKIIHYLLQSNREIKQDYLTPENIRTKDVLLCAKQRQLLKCFTNSNQSITKIIDASKATCAAPNIFIQSHRHFLVQRDRMLRQLQEVRFKKQLNYKYSQGSFPYVLSCRTGTNFDCILDREEIDGTPPQKSRQSNFDALIGITLDTTKKQEVKDVGTLNSRQTPLRVKPFRSRQAISENSRKSPSLNKHKKKATLRKKQERKNIRTDNPYLIVPSGKSTSKSRSKSKKNTGVASLINQYRLSQKNLAEKRHRQTIEQF